MRNYRNAAAALVLLLVLSMPGFAGIMYTDKAPPPPPPPPAAVMATDEADGQGVTQADSTSAAQGASDVVAEIALGLARSILTLF